MLASFENPIYFTNKFRNLKYVRGTDQNKKIKFYQASTSEPMAPIIKKI